MPAAGETAVFVCFLEFRPAFVELILRKLFNLEQRKSRRIEHRAAQQRPEFRLTRRMPAALGLLGQLTRFELERGEERVEKRGFANGGLPGKAGNLAREMFLQRVDAAARFYETRSERNAA